MSKQCIMCDQKADSKEHIFPAAFGGRRVARGIYCKLHNNSFGTHVSALQEAMGLLNASLGVRSDHHDSPKAHLIDGPDGEQLQILKGVIEKAPPPPLSETPDLIGRPVQLRFASVEQCNTWVEAQKRRGFKLRSIGESSVHGAYHTDPLKQEMRFGSPAFMRAVAYVALTFVARYFPDVVRNPGLENIKRYVKGEFDAKDLVWWIDPATHPIADAGAFRATHSVVLGLCANSGRATAMVAFFGQLRFAIDLGPVEARETVRVTTHIDPLAEFAGRDLDVKVLREPDAKLVLGTAEEGRDYLRAIVAQVVPNPVGTVLAQIELDNLDFKIARILPRLIEALSQGPGREVAVQAVLDSEGQHVLNLLLQVVDTVLVANPDCPDKLRQAILEVVGGGPLASGGLSQAAFDTLERTKVALAVELLHQWEKENLTAAVLKDLLAGNMGAAVVWASVQYSVMLAASTTS